MVTKVNYGSKTKKRTRSSSLYLGFGLSTTFSIPTQITKIPLFFSILSQSFELGKKLPNCQAAHTNIVYKYSLLFFLFIYFYFLFFIFFQGSKQKFLIASTQCGSGSPWTMLGQAYLGSPPTPPMLSSTPQVLGARLKNWFFACV